MEYHVLSSCLLVPFYAGMNCEKYSNKASSVNYAAKFDIRARVSLENTGLDIAFDAT